jgi:endogenous inhibitor of DNA gyrase (YacG/DUF329 family)
MISLLMSKMPRSKSSYAEGVERLPLLCGRPTDELRCSRFNERSSEMENELKCDSCGSSKGVRWYYDECSKYCKECELRIWEEEEVSRLPLHLCGQDSLPKERR